MINSEGLTHSLSLPQIELFIYEITKLEKAETTLKPFTPSRFLGWDHAISSILPVKSRHNMNVHLFK